MTGRDTVTRGLASALLIATAAGLTGCGSTEVTSALPAGAAAPPALYKPLRPSQRIRLAKVWTPTHSSMFLDSTRGGIAPE